MCSGYDTKQSDDEVPVMLELWEMWSNPLLPPDRVVSMGQIELNCVLMLNIILWNRTVLTFSYV